MAFVYKPILLTGAAFLAWATFNLLRVLYRQQISPLRHLREPKSPSWIYGHFFEIWKAVSVQTVISPNHKVHVSTLNRTMLFSKKNGLRN